jgi:hypothetical protein
MKIDDEYAGVKPIIATLSCEICQFSTSPQLNAPSQLNEDANMVARSSEIVRQWVKDIKHEEHHKTTLLS